MEVCKLDFYRCLECCSCCCLHRCSLSLSPPPLPFGSGAETLFGSVARCLGFPFPLLFTKSIDCQAYLMFQTMFFCQERKASTSEQGHKTAVRVCEAANSAAVALQHSRYLRLMPVDTPCAMRRTVKEAGGSSGFPHSALSKVLVCSPSSLLWQQEYYNLVLKIIPQQGKETGRQRCIPAPSLKRGIGFHT